MQQNIAALITFSLAVLGFGWCRFQFGQSFKIKPDRMILLFMFYSGLLIGVFTFGFMYVLSDMVLSAHQLAQINVYINQYLLVVFFVILGLLGLYGWWFIKKLDRVGI